VCSAEYLRSKHILMTVPLLVEEVDNDEDGQQPEFSLVTGQYRKAKRFGDVASPVMMKYLPQSFFATTKTPSPFYGTVRQVRGDVGAEPVPILK
jgi:hypothetical protein